MKRLIAAILLGAPAALMLAGCVTTSTSVAGSEIGGTIPMAGITRQQAADMARSHCAQYGLSAHILAVRREEQKAVFECTRT